MRFLFGASGAWGLCALGAMGRHFYAPLNFTVRPHIERRRAVIVHSGHPSKRRRQITVVQRAKSCEAIRMTDRYAECRVSRVLTTTCTGDSDATERPSF